MILASTSAQRGGIALARLRYGDAAKHFAKAVAVLPEGGTYDYERSGYLQLEADALRQQGNELGDNGSLLSAIQRYSQLLILRLRERAYR